MWGSSQAGKLGWAHKPKEGSHMQGYITAPVQVQQVLSSRALTLGELQLNLTFPPGHRAQSPHGLRYSKNLVSDIDTPIRSLESGPSFHPHPGPYPDYLGVSKVPFNLKGNASLFLSLLFSGLGLHVFLQVQYCPSKEASVRPP